MCVFQKEKELEKLCEEYEASRQLFHSQRSETVVRNCGSSWCNQATIKWRVLFVCRFTMVAIHYSGVKWNIVASEASFNDLSKKYIERESVGKEQGHYCSDMWIYFSAVTQQTLQVGSAFIMWMNRLCTLTLLLSFWLGQQMYLVSQAGRIVCTLSGF